MAAPLSGFIKKRMNMTLTRLRPLWYAIAGVLTLASVFALVTFGLKQGIEFTGGTLMAIRFSGERPSVVTAQETLVQAEREIGSVIIQPLGERDMQIRLKPIDEDQHQHILSVFKERFGDVTELRYDSIGPTIGSEIRSKSLNGLMIVLVAILAYIAYAFRKISSAIKPWKYGVVTIVAASFVVIVPLGLYAFLGRYYSVEIGTPFVAAILTIIGYSITDTIVVMDRVRENLQKMSASFEEVVEASIRQTFVRSITNSMATLLTLIAIFVFGGDTLDEFTLPLIVGIVIGTFASMLVASPLLVTWNAWGTRLKGKEKGILRAASR